MIERAQRRLAAIVSADVVGYSRLMGADETGTLAALRAHRAELIDATVAEYGGRIVKTMGDGLLLEFPSVVDATACAVRVQTSMAARNAEVAEDQRITFRIGVNLGDIIIEGDDILGDGVNIAARLEALAEPGGIAISGRVHEDVRDRLEVTFTDTGEQTLKNIARPMRVWQWSATEPASPPPVHSQSGTASQPLSLPDKPSIAVLPFENRSGDPEQEFFADGTAEDIISALSQFESLFVIARNSTFSFKGQSVSTVGVSEALGVRYVIDGSIRKAGNRIRVAAQLVDASSGSPIWAERYDRDLEDIFAVQDEITEAIVSAVAPEINEAERRYAQRKPPESLDVWGRYQRGLTAYYPSTQEGFLSAIQQFDQINELAPEFAEAFALAADARCRYTIHYGDPGAFLQEAEAKARRAVALEPNSAVCVCSLARVYSYRGLHDLAITKAQEAISLNENYAFANYSLGFYLFRAGRFEEAIAQIDRAIRQSPRDIFSSGFYGIRGMSLFCLSRYEEAAEGILRAMNAPNPRRRIQVWAAAVLVLSGRHQEAKAVLADYLREVPTETVAKFHQHILETVPQAGDAITPLINAVREAGLPE